jgi:hypothetical protein
MCFQASNHPALRGLKNNKLLTKVSFLPKKLSMTNEAERCKCPENSCIIFNR